MYMASFSPAFETEEDGMEELGDVMMSSEACRL
jgi:hypothetical protein